MMRECSELKLILFGRNVLFSSMWRYVYNQNCTSMITARLLVKSRGQVVLIYKWFIVVPDCASLTPPKTKLHACGPMTLHHNVLPIMQAYLPYINFNITKSLRCKCLPRKHPRKSWLQNIYRSPTAPPALQYFSKMVRTHRLFDCVVAFWEISSWETSWKLRSHP